MDQSPRIDAHTHLIPQDSIAALQAASREHAPRLEHAADGTETLIVGGGRITHLSDALFSIDVACAESADHLIDRVVYSPPPFMLFYGIPAEVGAAFARIQNDHLARELKAWPGRADGMATLPMQAPERAAEELRRTVRQLGLRGAIVGSNVNGKDLDAPEFAPVWSEAEALNVPIFVHPHDSAGRERMGAYGLRNLIGNPLDTTLAATRLIYGGVLERHPRLRVLLAHCGGYLLFALGRLEHAYSIRSDLEEAIPKPPSHYLRRCWFDTITHDIRSIRYALGMVGENRLVLGSDLPFDMADPEPVERLLNAPWLSETARARIFSQNAVELFGLS